MGTTSNGNGNEPGSLRIVHQTANMPTGYIERFGNFAVVEIYRFIFRFLHRGAELQQLQRNRHSTRAGREHLNERRFVDKLTMYGEVIMRKYNRVFQQIVAGKFFDERIAAIQVGQRKQIRMINLIRDRDGFGRWQD